MALTIGLLKKLAEIIYPVRLVIKQQQKIIIQNQMQNQKNYGRIIILKNYFIKSRINTKPQL